MVGPRVQMNHLSSYLKAVRYLIPSSHSNTPNIRHPDLSPCNIFISDSGDITGVIDWQHAVILLRFLQANIPNHFQNYGDDDSENFCRPNIVEGFNKMTHEEKEAAVERYHRRQVHYFYLGYTSNLNKAHFEAMGKHHLVLRIQLYDVATRPWEGDNTSL